MGAKPQISEKLMFFLFPMITLGLFILGVIVFHILPQLVNTSH